MDSYFWARWQVIIFSFSKKECEALALQMVSLDLNDEEEAKMVAAIFSNALDCLAEEDRRLPQVPLPSPNVLNINDCHQPAAQPVKSASLGPTAVGTHNRGSETAPHARPGVEPCASDGRRR